MKKKICNSDIVDLIIAALTETCSVTIIAYYSTNSYVQSQIFQPLMKQAKHI